MKVLIVGSGGREHAIAWKVAQSPKVDKIYCAPGNAGIAEYAECVDIAAMEFDKLVAFAKEKEIDLTVIGMDDPLVGGVVDAFEAEGLRVFGPRKNAAILEGSKAFSKDLMKKYHIPTAAYETFSDPEAAEKYLETAKFPIVLKADGLALGKGVLICNTLEEAKEGVKTIMLDKKFGSAGNEMVIEVTAPDGKPVEFTFFRPRQYGEAYAVREWPSFNAMLEGYYAEKDRAERLRTKSKELHKAVHNMYERAVRKQAARQEELAASGKSEKLRLYGELLSANLYLAQKGMKSITVPNWYDEGKEVTIPLDLRFTPSQNAQNFFKNYKKKQTAARMLVDLLAEGEKEIAYLETVLYEVESASGEAALNEIRAELKSQGYLKYYKQRDKRQKPADFLRFTSSDGFEILVGRNNAQNDKLTLHTARGKDLWFHVQKAPGSHVVVMSRGEDIPDTTRQEAAELAVIYSSAYKAGTGAKVAVDTTEVKNIWKASGAKPGMVLYEVYTTVYITPREDLAERLKMKK